MHSGCESERGLEESPKIRRTAEKRHLFLILNTSKNKLEVNLVEAMKVGGSESTVM